MGFRAQHSPRGAPIIEPDLQRYRYLCTPKNYKISGVSQHVKTLYIYMQSLISIEIYRDIDISIFGRILPSCSVRRNTQPLAPAQEENLRFALRMLEHLIISPQRPGGNSVASPPLRDPGQIAMQKPFLTVRCSVRMSTLIAKLDDTWDFGGSSTMRRKAIVQVPAIPKDDFPRPQRNRISEWWIFHSI